MNAIKVLSSIQVQHLFVELQNGTFRWITDDGHILGSGPSKEWVDRGLKLNNTSLGKIQQPLCHEIILKMVNRLNSDKGEKKCN